MQPQDYAYREETLLGYPIGVTTFRVRDRHFCHIDNVDPGATIARGFATTAEQAQTIAFSRASEALKRFRG